MATINLGLNIRKPAGDGIGDEIIFTELEATTDSLRIPRRYPFVDIKNYDLLKASGYFRHATTDVSAEMGGSKVTNTEANLGYALPPTEKLILLVRRVGKATDGTPKQTITLKGSLRLGIPDEVVVFAKDETFTSGTKIYELDLYNFGLYIGGVSGEDGLIINCDDITIDFALIARTN